MVDGAESALLAAIDFSACEAEPIRTPGLTQPYGCLLVLSASDGEIIGYSANAPIMLGRTLALGDLIDTVIGSLLWDQVLRTLAGRELDLDPRIVRLFEIAPAMHQRFETLAHRASGHILLEFVPRQTRAQPEPPAPLDGVRPDLFRLCMQAAEQVRRATGYDRVMVYRFHEDWTGEVIAELRRPELTPYIGLRYPATDIPLQARQLFRETLIRQIVDVDAPGAPLITSQPILDMSRAVLRSASPYHLEYLRNMGVAGTLTLSILVEGELWGLISCHHGAPRQVCCDDQQTILALTARLGARIEDLEREEAFAGRNALRTAMNAWRDRLDAPGGARTLLSHLSPLALDLRADGVAVVCGDACLSVGATPDADWLIDAAKQLRHRAPPGEPLSTDKLADVPGLRRPPEGIAGALITVLPGAPLVALFVFRAPLVHEVHWGGDPNRAALVSPDDGRMSPRRSFALWRDLVRDKARPWSEQKLGLFSFVASWLADGQRLDPAGFAATLATDLDEVTSAYMTPGKTQQLVVDVLPDRMGVLLWVTEQSCSRLIHANRSFVATFGLQSGELKDRAPDWILERTQLERDMFGIEIGIEKEFDIWSPTKGARRARARREYLVRYEGHGGPRTMECLLLSDVTADSRAHDALVAAVRHAEEAESIRGALLRNMSHELRTPLNAVLGYSDMLAEQLLGPLGEPAYLQAAQEIRAGARHLTSLIDNTLEVARLREGKLNLTEARVDLRDTMTAALRTVRPLADTKDIQIRWTQPDTPLMAIVDELAMRQIAINLLNNAVKFTANGGTVELDLQRLPEGSIGLSVADSGVGIPPRSLAKLFQPFSQVDSGRDRRHGGSGLGLSIVKSLTQLHGGLVEVESIEGKGSTFRVMLPAWRLEEPG